MTPAVVLLGGFADRLMNNMVRIATELRPLLPGREVHYWSHWQAGRAAALLAAGGAPIVLVGHSWGGDEAAALTLRWPGRVRRLVTLDPVGLRGPARIARLAGTDWVNVMATGGGPWERSNIVARIGRPYGPRACEAARIGIAAPVTHADARGMLLATAPDGRSVLRLIQEG